MGENAGQTRRTIEAVVPIGFNLKEIVRPPKVGYGDQCPNCNGWGRVYMSDGNELVSTPCPVCSTLSANESALVRCLIVSTI